MSDSYRSCAHYDKGIGKSQARLLPDKVKCQEAVNCRRCRRCPQVPESKLELWAKEHAKPW